MRWTGLCTRWVLRAQRILGAVWKDGACAICSVEELYNCPKEMCTADLHEGAVWGDMDCTDKNAGCAIWAVGGECDASPDYMLIYCAKSCGSCWVDGICAICSVEEVHSCPESMCTADLHEGAFELCFFN